MKSPFMKFDSMPAIREAYGVHIEGQPDRSVIVTINPDAYTLLQWIVLWLRKSLCKATTKR